MALVDPRKRRRRRTAFTRFMSAWVLPRILRVLRMIVRNPSHTTSEPVENKADRTMHLLLSSCKIPLSLQIRESGKNLMSGEKCLFSISSSSLYSCNRLAQNVHKSSSRQKEKGKNVQWSQRSKSTKAVAGKKKEKEKHTDTRLPVATVGGSRRPKRNRLNTVSVTVPVRISTGGAFGNICFRAL